ncbi:serine/threonine-protein kinase [Solimonas terrae]|nr:serine/threonine-protein kinase [Solimonas terrae]
MPMQIGKYELREEIGRGACGVVYKGFDPFVQREVALKFSLHDPEFRHDALHERAFFAEARAAGMLQHPHIVALHDAGVEGEISYIVMEYVDGETLQPLCRAGGERASLAQVLEIILKCAEALEFAHGKGVLHRDIKPSNIMLTRNGVPKLMDFSIAEISTAGRATSQAGQSVLGSPLYMSPEQIKREALGPASDLYSLGAVMFQLLVGAPPFNAQELPLLFRAIRNVPAPDVRALRPELPQAVADIVARLLRKEPAERFESGRELAICIGRLFDQLRLGDKPITPRESRDSLRRLRFFASFSDEEIDEILGASQMVSYRPGDVLMYEGELDSSFFIIALGTAGVQKNGKLLHQLEKGDCVGEIGFLTMAKRTATVVAVSRVLALKINARLLDQVSRDCQLRFYKVFTETLIYRLSLTSARLSALS